MQIDPLRGEIRQLRDTANMLATAHNREAQRYAFVDGLLTWTSIGASLVLLAFVFSTPEQIQEITTLRPLVFQRLAGTASILALLLSTVQLVTRPSGKGARHLEASEHYARIRHEAKFLLTKAVVPQDYLSLQTKHLSLRPPVIPDNRLLRSKSVHEQKVWISRQLSLRPGTSVNQLKSEMRKALRSGGLSRSDESDQ